MLQLNVQNCIVLKGCEVCVCPCPAGIARVQLAHPAARVGTEGGSLLSPELLEAWSSDWLLHLIFQQSSFQMTVCSEVRNSHLCFSLTILKQIMASCKRFCIFHLTVRKLIMFTSDFDLCSGPGV